MGGLAGVLQVPGLATQPHGFFAQWHGCGDAWRATCRCKQENGIYVIYCISIVPIRQTIEHTFFFGHSPFLLVMILTLMLSLRTKDFVGDLARIPGDDWCIEITDSELPVR